MSLAKNSPSEKIDENPKGIDKEIIEKARARLANKAVLITGGAGFIGSNLAFFFQEYFPSTRVIVLDKFRDGSSFPNGNPTSLGHFKNLIGFNGEIIARDLNEGLDLLQELDFDVVFHQAAISDTTVENQKLMINTNHHAFLELLHIALKKNAVVVYASSAATYGNTPAPNVVGKNEEPQNIYGFSKLAMDKSVRKILANAPHLPIFGLRYFNVYGGREFYKGKTASMILQLGLQALESKKVRLIEKGEQKRDFVYIDDVVAANVLAMNEGFEMQKLDSIPKSGIYNVGTGLSRSYNEIVAILKNHLGDFEVEYFKNPYPFFQTHTQADIQPNASVLGYKPKYSLEQGIESYINEIKSIHTKLKSGLLS